MKYILIITFILIALFSFKVLCNQNKEIIQHVEDKQRKLIQISPKEYQTKIIIDDKQKSDYRIKVKVKKSIIKIINIKDSSVLKLTDSTFSIRIDEIDSFIFNLRDNNINVIVPDTTTKIIELNVSKKQKSFIERNKYKIGVITGIITTSIIIILLK